MPPGSGIHAKAEWIGAMLRIALADGGPSALPSRLKGASGINSEAT